MNVDQMKAVEMYRSMLRSRRLEESLIEALSAGKPAHVGHPASGQEAVAAGTCAALRRDDRLYCSHRTKHWALSKGCNLEALAAEYWGKAVGLARGWGGEMHIMDNSVGFIGSNHVVAGNIPVAVGSALAAKLDGGDRVTVVAFGDGASVQGTFHEGLNLAAIWGLPVLFLCENNQYAESTPVEYHSHPSEIYRKASVYDIPSVRVDGQDVLAVYDIVQKMVAGMRKDRKARFIEALTYRYLGHFYGDKTTRYRTPEEEAIWRGRDPITIFEKQSQERRLLSSGDLARIKKEVDTEVAAAMKFAEESAYPDLSELEATAYSQAV